MTGLPNQTNRHTNKHPLTQTKIAIQKIWIESVITRKSEY